VSCGKEQQPMRALECMKFSLLVVAVAWNESRSAQANGRFPQSQYVVLGPGRSDDLIAVRTTFGLVVSDDGGRRFRFYCEELFQYQDGYDPALVWTSNGSLLVGVADGLTVARDFCVTQRRDELQGNTVVDLASDAVGNTVLAALRSNDSVSVMRVARSTDGGATFVVPREGLGEMVPWTVDVAPGDARRAYATATEGEGSRASVVVLRSDNGGTSWTRTRANFPGLQSAFIAGVDPTQASTVYLRAPMQDALDGGALGGASTLWKSEDGGDTFREIARTRGIMAGFALSSDGSRVWYGGPNDGLYLSRGGDFQNVSTDGVDCLRWHADALYVCGSLGTGAAVLSRSRDEGRTRTPLVQLSEILPPLTTCRDSSVVQTVCSQVWPVIRRNALAQLGDAGIDVSRDASGVDVVGAEETGGGGSCDRCAATPRASQTDTLVGFGLLAMIGMFRRRPSTA
jgi:hypothetical protein